MVFLFVQTWIWLIAAALLGILTGWILWRPGKSSDKLEQLQRQLEECRRQCAELESIEAEEPIERQAATDQFNVDTDRSTDGASGSSEYPDLQRPTFLSEPDGKSDDLKQISGIGPVIEKTLNSLGVYHFRQIGAFTEDNIKWINNYLGFPGRIEREDWIGQVSRLYCSDGSVSKTERHDDKDETTF